MNNISHKDMVEIEGFQKWHPYAELIRSIKSWNFEVGEVLVKEIKDHSGNAYIEDVSSMCKVPKKYKVVHIDELGIPWVKQISVRGGLGNKIFCLATAVSKNISFKVDPEKLNSILLGYEYDPRIEYKMMRNDNPDYGKIKNETK